MDLFGITFSVSFPHLLNPNDHYSLLFTRLLQLAEVSILYIDFSIHSVKQYYFFLFYCYLLFKSVFSDNKYVCST